MEIHVEVSDEEGNEREYVGIEVCRGPGVMRVLLTRPYRLAGQTVSVPLDQVESIAEIENGLLGDPVKPVEAVTTGERTHRGTERDHDHERDRHHPTD